MHIKVSQSSLCFPVFDSKHKNKAKHGRDGCRCDKEVNEEPDLGMRAALLTAKRHHMTCEDASVAMLVVAGY